MQVEPWLVVRGRPGHTNQPNQLRVIKMATKKTTTEKAAPKAKPAAKKAPAKKAPAKKPAAKKAAPAPAPVKGTKKASTGTYADLAANRFQESKVEHPVRAMWDLCDKMVDNRRKDVIAAAVAAGISYYTARTQYQLWLTAWRNSK